MYGTSTGSAGPKGEVNLVGEPGEPGGTIPCCCRHCLFSSRFLSDLEQLDSLLETGRIAEKYPTHSYTLMV